MRDRGVRSREVWGRKTWVLTLGILVVFPPLGIAALLRKWAGQRVWGDCPPDK